MQAQFLTLVVVCGVAACGGSGNGSSAGSPDSGAMDGATPVDGQAVEAASEAGGGGTNDGGDDSGAPPPYSGFVLVFINDTPGQAASYESDGASFSAYTGPSCGTTPGTCCYVPPSSGSTAAPVGGGTVTVTDGSTTIVTLSETDAGYSWGPLMPWQPGDTLAFAGTGDVVHAFTGSLTAPPTLVLSAPSDGLALPRTSDLSVQWSAGTASTVVLVQIVAYTSSNMPDGSVFCAFSDTGSGVVPTTDLVNLKANDTASVAVGRVTRSTATCDNADVTLEVGSAVVLSELFQ